MVIYTAAAAMSGDEICISRFDDEKYDFFEPFSSVSFYVHDDARPSFYYVNLPQYIVSITVFFDRNASAKRFATLSAEGQFTSYADDRMIVEQIPGAGSISDAGAPKRGRLEALRQIGATLFACGSGGQVYRRLSDGAWALLTESLLSSQARLSDYFARIPSLGDFDSKQDWQAWMASNPLPREQDLCDLNGLDERSIYLIAEQGGIFYWNGEFVVPVPAIVSDQLTRVLVENEKIIWICGHKGALYKGNHREGFQRVSTGGSQMFLSMAQYQGELYLCSHTSPSGVFRWNPKKREFDLVSAPAANYLHSITVVDDVMWVVGLSDILRFDGSVWDHIHVQGLRDIS